MLGQRGERVERSFARGVASEQAQQHRVAGARELIDHDHAEAVGVAVDPRCLPVGGEAQGVQREGGPLRAQQPAHGLGVAVTLAQGVSPLQQLALAREQLLPRGPLGEQLEDARHRAETRQQAQRGRELGARDEAHVGALRVGRGHRHLGAQRAPAAQQQVEQVLAQVVAAVAHRGWSRESTPRRLRVGHNSLAG